MAIVLIEDHESLRASLTHLLESEGFRVIALECAEDLDDTLGTHAADAYLVDINLPGEDGLSVVHRLRKTSPRANIIIMTAYGELESRIKGYEAGADVFLPKPVDPDELLAVLKSRVKRGSNEAFQYSLDQKSQIISGGPSPIHLSLTETRILSALAIANENILEKWQVMELFTPEDGVMNADNLQMRISRLRKKFICAGVTENVIKAERNLGYRLTINLMIEL